MKGTIDPSALSIDSGAQKRPTAISIVDAGGKTSLLFQPTKPFQVSGRRVLITMTTHMLTPTSHWPMVSCRDPAISPHASFIPPISFRFHYWKANQGKVQGSTPEAIDTPVQRPEYDIILIETDGSRGMPLRVSDERESCIPRSSRYVIAMMGGRILGAKVNTENVHRWLQFADITGLTLDTPLQLSDLVALVRYPQGASKNVP